MPGAPLEFHAYIFLTPRLLSFFRRGVKCKKYRQCVDFGSAGIEGIPQGARISGEVAVGLHIPRRWLVARH